MVIVAGPPGFEPGTSAGAGLEPCRARLRVKSPPLYLAELRAHQHLYYIANLNLSSEALIHALKLIIRIPDFLVSWE